MYKNYKLIKEENLKDINSKGILLEHEKTGAKIVLFENDDENKTYAIGFRTPPYNDTGIPHILEHSVLCGSRKYPVKEPFVELMKSSLNTFLNAMTFSDKTMYPVSSCNIKDFRNLTDVYMDAVFYPSIYQKEAIFKQEGWHYELFDKDGEITYNGVVYNEMKGAFSSPDGVLERVTMSTLFPDTAYGVESGGDPDYIPDLSYQKFLEFHKKYYHPSNSYIIIYGDCDMEEQLQYLDEEYLSKFDKLEIDSSLKVQAPFTETKVKTMEYPVSKEQGTDHKALMSYAVALTDKVTMTENVALDIISAVLLDIAGAPIERALLDAKLGSAITGGYDNGILQPMFVIQTKDVCECQKDEFVNVIEDTLRKLVKEGLNKKMLEAALNRHEFKTREADFGGMSKGLIYGINALSTWLYDKDPFAFAKYDEIYGFLRSKLETNYFEELIEKYILNNTHKAITIVNPSLDIAERKEKALKEKLATYKASLTEEQIEQLIKDTNELKAYQAREDSKEDLATIPMLKKEDLSYEVQPISNIEHVVKGVKSLHHDFNTNGISYIHLVFDVKDVPNHLVPYLGIYEALFGSLDTSKHTYQTLEQDVNISTGGIGANFSSISTDDGYWFQFRVNASYVKGKAQTTLDFIDEIINTTSFTTMKQRIMEILQTQSMRMQQLLVGRGNGQALTRALSYSEPSYYLRDKISGIDYAQQLMSLLKSYDEQYDELIKALQEINTYIFTKETLLASFTGSVEDYQEFEEALSNFIEKLGHKEEVKDPFKFIPNQKNEGFCAPYDVNYVALAGNFKKAGIKYSGAFMVFQNAVVTSYLWTQIRVLGGAYGCGCNFNPTGDSYFVSYRDPNIERTLQQYKDVLKYIDDFKATDEEMLKYIIGAVGSVDTPLSPYSKGLRSLSKYLTGQTIEEVKEIKRQIIDATEADIHAMRKVVEAIIEQNNLCTIGNEKKVQATNGIFTTKLNLLK